MDNAPAMARFHENPKPGDVAEFNAVNEKSNWNRA